MNTNIAYLKTNNIKYFKLLNILIILPHEEIHYFSPILYNRHKNKRIYPKTIDVQIHTLRRHFKALQNYCPTVLINIY